MLGAIGAIASGVGALGSIFAKPKYGSPGHQETGFGALPPEAQQAFLQYLQHANNLNPNQYFDPNSMVAGYDSQMQDIMQRLGQGNLNGLGDFMNPYQQQVVDNTRDQIMRVADQQKSDVIGNSARLNSKAFGNSATGTQLGMIDQGAQQAFGNAAANLNYQGYQNAVQNRRQSLLDALGVGQMNREYQQQLMDVNNPFLRTGMYGDLLNKFPNSSNAIGGTPDRASNAQKAFGALSGLGSYFGGFGGK